MDLQQLFIGERSYSYFDQGYGQAVFLLHGFPDHIVTWLAQIDTLNQEGFRCIVPYLRGYEVGSLAESYFIDDCVEDLRSFQQQLGLDKFHLIGHDWGAVISYAFAARYPEALYSVNCLAIPPMSAFKKGLLVHPKQRWNSAYMAFFNIPIVSEWWCRRRNFAFIESLWRRWSPEWNFSTESIEAVKRCLSQPGVLSASLGYYRHIYSWGSGASQMLLSATINVPCLVIAGENDGCMDVRLFHLLNEKPPFEDDYQISIVKNAGHFMQQEKPAEVSALLLNWLQTHGGLDKAKSKSG